MIVYAFPCDSYLATHFLHRIDTKGSVALMLRKQKESLWKVLASANFNELFVLDEDFYGKISTETTWATLVSLREKGVSRAYFPMNDFCGNTALMLAVLTDNVAAVNATSEVPIALSIGAVRKGEDTGTALSHHGERLQSEIVGVLNEAASVMDQKYAGTKGGERPTSGLLHNAPYDCEVLSRYLYAGSLVKGNVLEIGCGIGYGAFSVVRTSSCSSITALDYNKDIIELAKRLWVDPRLMFEISQAERLPFEDASFDSIICYEVIEHVHNPSALLKEIYRVLKKGGILIGSTPNFRLYPYRVNKSGANMGPELLRKQGIWPWHVHGFDEESIQDILVSCSLTPPVFKYPTFVRGLRILETMRSVAFNERLELLEKQIGWSSADFAILDEYIPIFSGFSFIFEAYKEVH